MLYVFLACVAGVTADCCLRKFLQLTKYPCTIVFSLLSCALLLFTFDNPVRIIKGLFFAQMLIAIGYCDAIKHEIPNLLLIPILLGGMILLNPVPSIVGFFFVALPLLIVSMITNGAIGGGDVKLMAACGFFLGASGVFCATFLGLTIFLIAYPLFYRKHKKANYAMAPYLGIGCFLVYLLQI